MILQLYNIQAQAWKDTEFPQQGSSDTSTKLAAVNKKLEKNKMLNTGSRPCTQEPTHHWKPSN